MDGSELVKFLIAAAGESPAACVGTELQVLPRRRAAASCIARCPRPLSASRSSGSAGGARHVGTRRRKVDTSQITRRRGHRSRRLRRPKMSRPPNPIPPSSRSLFDERACRRRVPCSSAIQGGRRKPVCATRDHHQPPRRYPDDCRRTLRPRRQRYPLPSRLDGNACIALFEGRAISSEGDPVALADPPPVQITNVATRDLALEAHTTMMVRARPLISADASTRFARSCCLLQPDVTTFESASASRRHVPGPVGCAPTRCGTNRHMDTCSRNFAFAWRVAVDLCTQAQ
jgi:hypothetical protein